MCGGILFPLAGDHYRAAGDESRWNFAAAKSGELEQCFIATR